MKYIKETSCGFVPFIRVENKVKFLIVKHKKGHWGFPKGHIEKGEGELECAIRELHEETNLTVSKMEQEFYAVEEYSFFNKKGNKILKKVVFFMAEVKGDICLQECEISKALFLPFKDITKKLSYESQQSLLKKVKKHLEK